MQFHKQLVTYSHLLNDNEQEILEYILSKKENVKSLTLQMIAEEHFVAPNTIVRMCKKLNFDGYSEFKVSYMNTLKDDDSLNKTIDLQLQLKKTDQIINQTSIDQAVNALRVCNKIAIFSSGLSMHVGNNMEERLRIVGKKIHSFSDESLMMHSAKRLTDQDCVFVISMSGETQVPLNAVILAKSMGASIISITGLSSNSIADLADLALYGYCEPNYFEGIDIADRFVLYYISSIITNKYIQSLSETPTV